MRGVEVRGLAGLPVEPVPWPVSPAGQMVVSAWPDQSIDSTDQEQLVFQSVVDELAAGAEGPGEGGHRRGFEPPGSGRIAVKVTNHYGDVEQKRGRN